MTTRFIPDRKDFDTHEQWDAHVQAYQMIHELQEEIRKLKGGKKSDIGHGPDSPITPEKIVATTINGIFVKAGSPTNGQTIRFNSASQQFEFGA